MSVEGVRQCRICDSNNSTHHVECDEPRTRPPSGVGVRQIREIIIKEKKMVVRYRLILPVDYQ